MSREVRVGTFGGASALPILVAAHTEIFKDVGLQTRITFVRSSDELIELLVAGQLDVIHASADDIVFWRDSLEVPLVAWMGGSIGPVILVAQPSISDITQLRGQVVGVDSPLSGFVSILRRALRHARVDDQVKLVPHGSTPQRLEALRGNRIAATMLSLPWSVAAVEEGYRKLHTEEPVDYLLQLGCGASFTQWVAENPGVAIAYYRAVVAGLARLYAPASRDEAIDLVGAALKLDARSAITLYAAMVDSAHGWPPSAYLNPKAMEAICDLRGENDQPAKFPATEYYTHAPYRELMRFSSPL